MSPPPVISVIVPVYNAEKTLRKCVESICNSSYPHLEIICINDGSTDSSPDILKHLAAADSRIIVINQKNSGVSAARNAGLDTATGEYVTGVDSDDYIEPDLYEQAIGKLTDDTDVVAFGIAEEYIPPEAKPAKKMYPDEPFTGYRDITEPVILHMHAMFWPRLWRRSIIESHHIRFAHGVRFEDADFFLKSILHCKKAYFLQYRGYHYLQHAESYMGQQFSGHADLPPLLDVERRLHAYLQETGTWLQHRNIFAHLLVRHSTSSRYYFSTLTQAQVQEAYYRLSLELGLQDELPDDFPLQTLKPITGWRKLFLTHLPNTSIYRLLGIPICYRRYEKGAAKWGIFNHLGKLIRWVMRLAGKR